MTGKNGNKHQNKEWTACHKNRKKKNMPSAVKNISRADMPCGVFQPERTIHMIYFLTSNDGKFREVRNALSLIGINVENINAPHPEIQSDSLEDVVQFKGEWARKVFPDRAILTDDSALFIDALNGFPGVYSSHAFRTIGCSGIIDLMRNKTDRSARFVCAFSLFVPDLTEPIIVKGVSEGYITKTCRGQGGFGFDPIFMPTGCSATFAEMSISQKNMHSHRGKALRKLVSTIKKMHLF